MRESLYAATLTVIAGLTWQVHRMPRNHLTIPVYLYLVCQFCFVGLSLLAKLDDWNHERFSRLFYPWELLVAFSMLWLVLQFGRGISRHDFLLILWTGVSVSATVCYLLRGATLLRTSGCFFLGCGVVGLLTLCIPSGTLVDTLKAWLSVLWLLTGMAWLCYVALYQRGREDVVSQTELWPAVGALLILLALSFSLYHQSESAKQGSVETMEMERMVSE